MKKLLTSILIASMALFAGCNKQKNELYIYNWTEYMPDEVIKQFEKETGIKVIYATFDSNELMYSKIKLQNGGGYDLIFPSSYYVSKMSREGLLLELDHSKLANLGNINHSLLNQSYDPDNKYSVPYMWGLSLLAYNDKYVDPATVKGWKDLWSPEYKGYVLLNNDVREVFQMALTTLGYPGNSTDPKQLEEAYLSLTTLMPNVRVFNSDSPKQPFINEEVRIGIMWSGEIYRAMNSNEHINYVFPEEGAIVWMDCMAMPKGAKNIDNAYKFMDFIMRPEIATLIYEDVGYSTPNKVAIDMMDEETKGNRLLNPTDEDLANAQFQDDIGEAVLVLEKYWERLKTGK